MDKYEILEIDAYMWCGCCQEIMYILKVNWENVYDSSEREDCLEGIINREWIDLIED